MSAFGEFPSLQELINAVLAGNEGAKHVLYEAFNPDLRAFVYSYLRTKGCQNPKEDAPGVVNRAWFNVFNGLNGLRQYNSFPWWAKAIARREADHHLRDCIDDQNHTNSIDNADLPAAQITDPEDLMNAGMMAGEILAIAKEHLPDFYPILKAYYIEGLSFKEISERCGIPYAAIRSTFYRGLKKLREILRDKGFDI